MFKGKDTRLAYFGGLFDGEGCISIIKGKNGRGNVQYSLRTIVTNTNKYVLQLYQLSFGGCVREHKSSHIKWRDCYTWELSSRQAFDFLKTIYPYLVIKRAEADVAFEFQDRQSVQRNKPIPDTELAVREAQRILMQELKRP